jgi:hypothetical protein
LAENNKKLFDPQFTSPVETNRTDINQAQAKREVNSHVEIPSTNRATQGGVIAGIARVIAGRLSQPEDHMA